MEAQRPNVARPQRIASVVVLACVGAGFLLLAGRVWYIGTALGPKLTALADRQQQGQRVIPARRGLIFDTRGRIAAGSKQGYSVYADPALAIAATDEAGGNLADVARTAATILGMDAGLTEYRIRTSRTRRFCWLKRHVSDVQADAIRRADLPGIRLQPEMRRTYPLGARMAHVLGVTGIDGQGLEGLEKAYDQHLSGQDGRYNTLYDARRRAITGRETGTVEPQDGGHVVLTIDAVIQEFTEEQLARRIEEHEAQSGVAVVMDPDTGEILAMACWPTFNPCDPAASSPEDRRNRTVTDPMEPGSTLKPFVASGALEHRVVTLTETIDCGDGTHSIGGRVLMDTHPCGPLTLEGIVVHSSNIGMGIIGSRMGNARLHEVVRRFGFGEMTGVGFPGESAGQVAPLSEWTSYSATSVPMGYEISVTPLQLVTAYCAIVNGGILLRPRLVKALLSADGQVVESFDTPIAVRRVLSTEIACHMTRKVLTEVVRRGHQPGSNLDLYEYPLLGKTGTAKLPYADRPGYEPGAYLSSFVGAAPACHPRAVALVAIHRPNPNRGYYGRTVAAPAVKEILFSTLSYLGVPGRGAVQAGL